MSQVFTLLSRDVRMEAVDKVYDTLSTTPGFAEDAIRAARLLDEELAWRAVALLLRLARDRRLSESDIDRIASIAEELPHWIAKLTLCQLFAETGCPAMIRPKVYPFLSDCFEDRRVIIRAWAISALVRFTAEPDSPAPARRGAKPRLQLDPRYGAEIIAMIRRARKDPGKSMQARLRRLGLKRLKD